jgi:hypothetical protein
MPQIIPLQSIPNQSFNINLDGNLWDIVIRTTDGLDPVTVMSLTINGALVIENLIAAAAAPIIPAQYQENGNFMFLTANNQMPIYSQFNVTQSLFYFSAAELAALRVPAVAASPEVPTVTAASFNPIAQLPLRFAPQGYEAA